jgi:hypothetical protein
MIENETPIFPNRDAVLHAVRALGGDWTRKKDLMAKLKARAPAAYTAVLCLLYDVWPYPVTGDDLTEGAPTHELGQFFISYRPGDFPDAPIVPLARTLQQAYDVGANVLRLEALFQRECDAQAELPHICFVAEIPTVEAQLARVVAQTRQFEPMSATELALKGSEESGEFASAVLVETGAIRHKSLKEPSFGEAADTILCMVSALAKLYPDMSPEEVSDELAKWLHIKQLKYDILLQGNEAAASSASQ